MNGGEMVCPLPIGSAISKYARARSLGGTNSCRGVFRSARITRSFFTPAATISLSTISLASGCQSRGLSSCKAAAKSPVAVVAIIAHNIA
jgi:hypothetical protein